MLMAASLRSRLKSSIRPHKPALDEPQPRQAATLSSLSPAQQLLRWIQACNELHGEHCQVSPMSARSKEQIPQWVIDTEQGCIVPGTSASRYVALSYVWPPQAAGVDRLMLERSNIEALQQPGVLAQDLTSRLPLCVRETIELMKEVQERYLWVDCLCIVQHDGDTQSQAYSMNEIYSGAYFTVIAAGTTGLLSDDRNAVISYGDIVTVGSHYDALMRSNWATRGWTFQEQILSKRAIIFMDPYRVAHYLRSLFLPGEASEAPIQKHVFWDCQRAVWDGKKLEPGSKTWPLPKWSLKGTKNEELNIDPLKLEGNARPKFRSYLESVCLYNDRSFTYPQDVLVAFSGVLNELGPSFPGGFVQGLPQCSIDESLIWQPFSKAVKRKNVIHDGVAPYRYLPSWSWCAWKCPVDPHSLVTGLQYSADPDYRLLQRSWRTQPLVEWSMMSVDLSREFPLKHAAMQYTYKGLTSSGVSWDANDSSKHCEPNDEGGDFQCFTYASSSSQRASCTLPVGGASSLSSEQMAQPYLSCTTRRAWFTIGEFLRCNWLFHSRASVKTSVFDLPQFKDGPDRDGACSVVSLESSTGEWVGVLRVMDGEQLSLGRELELVAISRGEASYADIVRAFEERVDFLRTVWFGATSLLWGATKHMRSRPVDQETTQPRPQDLIDAFREEYRSFPRSEELYMFYNVMWIEWEDGKAHRRAVGRVRKEAWERYCSEPIKIILA